MPLPSVFIGLQVSIYRRALRGVSVSLKTLALAGSMVGCASAPGSGPVSTYAEAKASYVTALERDIRAAGYPTAQLVPIPPMIEPFKPGAAFKPGSARPISHACIVPEARMPAAKRVPELWVRGVQPQFTLAGDLPTMVKVGVQEVVAVAHAATLKRSVIFSLADTRQLSLQSNDLIAILRNEPCLDALVANDVLMVQGVLYGAEAVASSRYLDVGAHEATLRNKSYRAMYDAVGNFYLQETNVRPKYWIMSGWRLDIKVDKDVVTPEQRAQILKAIVESTRGELVVTERVLTDEEILTFLETLRTASEKRRTR
ncbi:hypothetical protein YTPLAS18_35150 [Nitrospira sp.]|nr:hypothetical protein YTPLAS18_35150 [Nitrospira sp.]